MKTFKEYIKEHPNLRARIIAKINPMDKLRDKMDDLKKLPGKVKDKAMDKLQKTMDKVNPLSPINKKMTQMKQAKITKLKDKMDAINPLSAINIGDTKSIEKKISKLRDKKRDNTDQNKKLGVKIKKLSRQKKGSKKT